MDNDTTVSRQAARSMAMQWSKESMSASQTHSLLLGKNHYRLLYVLEEQYPCSPVHYMQIGCSRPRTSPELPQWNPLASLVTLYTVNFLIQSYAAGSSPKRLTGTRNTIPHLFLIYPLNDQPRFLFVTDGEWATPPSLHVTHFQNHGNTHLS